MSGALAYPVLPDTAGECRLHSAAGRAEEWNAALARAPAQPVGYHRSHGDYQQAYFSAAFPDYRVLDCLFEWRGETIALWPVSLYRQGEAWVLSSHLNGAPGIVPPLPLVELSDKGRRALTLAWLEALAHLTAPLPGETRLALFAPGPAGHAADWYARLLKQGARSGLRHRLVADLTWPEEAYHRNLRKSYKALINQARRLWQVTIDAQGDAAAFAEFQALHVQVAGRQTRPQVTWDRQFDAIRQHAAFAVYLREADGRLIGGSLYNCSRDEAYYAVGAYDRQLFDLPVAHLSLDAAIHHARASGRRQFILGDRPFPGDQPPPSDKEAKIAFFKEGFATALQLLPTLEIAAAQLASLRPEEAGR